MPRFQVIVVLCWNLTLLITLVKLFLVAYKQQFKLWCVIALAKAYNYQEVTDVHRVFSIWIEVAWNVSGTDVYIIRSCLINTAKPNFRQNTPTEFIYVKQYITVLFETVDNKLLKACFNVGHWLHSLFPSKWDVPGEFSFKKTWFCVVSDKIKTVWKHIY